MSHKTVICFAIWTSFWSALFNHFYTVYFGSFGVPWIMLSAWLFTSVWAAHQAVPGMILPHLRSGMGSVRLYPHQLLRQHMSYVS